MTPLDIARDYFARGWNPVPIPHAKKGPVGNGWQKVTITEANIEQYFNRGPQNIGVQLGPKSNGLTDVDLDCVEAVALARDFLPETGAIFGRETKQNSHWLYYIDDPGPKGSHKLTDEGAVAIIELRTGGGGKGAQTVFRDRRTKRRASLSSGAERGSLHDRPTRPCLRR